MLAGGIGLGFGGFLRGAGFFIGAAGDVAGGHQVVVTLGIGGGDSGLRLRGFVIGAARRRLREPLRRSNWPSRQPMRERAWRTEAVDFAICAPLFQPKFARRDGPVRRSPGPALTAAPTLTGVAITRPATSGAMSDCSSAVKMPVSSKSAGTSRDCATAVETADGFDASDAETDSLSEPQAAVRMARRTRYFLLHVHLDAPVRPCIRMATKESIICSSERLGAPPSWYMNLLHRIKIADPDDGEKDGGGVAFAQGAGLLTGSDIFLDTDTDSQCYLLVVHDGEFMAFEGGVDHEAFETGVAAVGFDDFGDDQRKRPSSSFRSMKLWASAIHWSTPVEWPL